MEGEDIIYWSAVKSRSYLIVACFSFFPQKGRGLRAKWRGMWEREGQGWTFNLKPFILLLLIRSITSAQDNYRAHTRIHIHIHGNEKEQYPGWEHYSFFFLDESVLPTNMQLAHADLHSPSWHLFHQLREGEKDRGQRKKTLKNKKEERERHARGITVSATTISDKQVFFWLLTFCTSDNSV